MIAIAFSAGCIAGAILLFLSHVAPMFGAGNFLRDMDEPRLFGKFITRREAHVVGAFAHLLISGLAGAAYGALIRMNVIPDFGFLPILGWSVVLSIAMGGIILPLEGHGLFGVKEDVWFPVDLFLTNILWGILFWGMMRLWPGTAY